MDERRTVPIEAEAATRRAPRRGTPFWLQLLGSVIVLVGAAIAWAWFFPGAREQLAAWGIPLPGPAAETAAPQAGGAPGANPGPGPGGAPGSGRPGGGQGRGGARAAVVVTAAATSAVINDKLTAIGEGVAAHSVTVTSAANGTLVDVVVKPGQAVKAGDVVAELDSASEQIAFDRAKLAADDAAAALKRASELRQSQSVSSVQLNAAQLANDQAQLELRNAQLALGRRSITTPISGTVGLLQVTPGNLVNAQTPVTTIEDASDILVNFWVPERYVSAIQPGMAVTALAIALPGKSFEGTVGALDNRVDPQSRTLAVQAHIANPDGLLRPGMSFQVQMSFPGERYVAVDPLAIQWSSDGAYVWRLVDGKVSKAMVKIVERNSDGVLVSGDIAEGDQIVTQGVLQLQQGQAVRLLDDPGAGRQPGGQQAPAGQQGQGSQAAQGNQDGQGGQQGQAGQQGAQGGGEFRPNGQGQFRPNGQGHRPGQGQPEATGATPPGGQQPAAAAQ